MMAAGGISQQGGVEFCEPVADTGAVVVAYAPDLGRLEQTLVLLSRQCEVLLVDNSDRPDVARGLMAVSGSSGVEYLPMGGNKGIAAAQNAGVAWMLERGKRYVLLLDDDSRPQPSLVSRLRATDQALRRKGEPVAVVGARARSDDGVDISNAQRNPGDVTLTRDMMSSGSLISMDVLRDIGEMEERLFIDCVDFEWGWRAQARGLKLFLANDVYFQHALGTGHVSVLGLRVGIPAPIRHYYQSRNVLWMMGRDYVPRSWKLKQLIGLLAKPVFFSLLVRPRLARIGYMMRGVKDAFLRKGGGYAR